MQLSKAANFGNPHIGLFARASDRLVLADASSSPKFLSSLASLGTPAVLATFGGSGLAGIHAAMNSHGLVLPEFCSMEEIGLFKSHGLEIAPFPGKYCAAGNNIAANDFGAVANPHLPRELVEKARDALGVEVVRMQIGMYSTVGSMVIATNKGFACHNRATEEELKELQSILRVEGQNCTLNAGVPFVSICATANSRAALVGESSTGFEAGRLAEALSLF